MEAQESVLDAEHRSQASPPPLDDGDAELIAQLIHDLKNPLGVILCYAEIVQEAKDSERREFCERLQANARALIEILNGFALLSDLRGGRVELSSQGFDWVNLVTSVVAGLQPVADLRDQRLACETADGRPIRGDRPRLEQALRHLLLEALRVAPSGAAVRICVPVDDAQTGAQVVISDGQCAAIQGARRADGAVLSASRPGMELAQRVIALHGGSVSVATSDSGVVITVALPVA